MTYPVAHIAYHILQKTGGISTMKLQKLAYYCQAWSLAWDDRPLIKEDFQAWANGPVCPELYQLHKGKYNVSAADIPSTEVEADIDEYAIETIDAILETYGDLEGYELSQISHLEEPWIKARDGLSPAALGRSVIPQERIQKFYKSQDKS